MANCKWVRVTSCDGPDTWLRSFFRIVRLSDSRYILESLWDAVPEVLYVSSSLAGAKRWLKRHYPDNL